MEDNESVSAKGDNVLNADIENREETNATVEDLMEELTLNAPPVNTERDDGPSKRLALAKPSITDIDLPKIDPKCTKQMLIYKKMMKLYATIGKLFGAQLTYEWIPHHHFMYYVASAFLYFNSFSIAYSEVYHWKNGDYKKMIEPFSTVGMSMSCNVKWYTFLKHFPKMWSLYFFARALCLDNLTGVRSTIMETGLNNTWSLLKVFAVGVITLLSVYVSVPVYYFFVKNEWVPLIPMEVIFCDQSTLSGFLSASAVMSVIGLYGFLATVMYGTGFLMCMSNYQMLCDLIGQDLKDLDAMWADLNETSAACRYDFLRNICKKVQDLNRYLNTLRDIYELKFFIYFCSNYIAQVICLYQIRMNGWVPGYTVFFASFMEMLFCCFIGTQISVGSDKLCYMLYDTNWYSYDQPSQKTIRGLLHDCQQPKHLMLGTFGPLNVVTGLQITKSIFSMYTVMEEVM